MLFCKKYDLFSYRKYKTSKYGVSSFNVATFGSNNYIILTLHWTDHFSGFIIGNVSHSSWRLCVFFFCWSNCFTSSHTNISIVLSSGLCAGQFPKYWTSSSTINYFVARDVWHGALSFWKKKISIFGVWLKIRRWQTNNVFLLTFSSTFTNFHVPAILFQAHTITCPPPDVTVFMMYLVLFLSPIVLFKHSPGSLEMYAVLFCIHH